MNYKTEIHDFLAENILFSDDGFSLGDDISFLDEGLIDSTGVLDLVLFVEDTFQIEVDDDDIVPANFDTVNNLAAYIDRKSPLAVH